MTLENEHGLPTGLIFDILRVDLPENRHVGPHPYGNGERTVIYMNTVRNIT